MEQPWISDKYDPLERFLKNLSEKYMQRLKIKRTKLLVKDHLVKNNSMIQVTQLITPLQYWSQLHCQYLLAENREP
jgi:hypothetical protein